MFFKFIYIFNYKCGKKSSADAKTNIKKNSFIFIFYSLNHPPPYEYFITKKFQIIELALRYLII